MKKSTLWSMLLALVLLLQLAAEGLTLAIVWRLDMLPAKYMTVLIVAFVLLGVLTAIVMFRGRKRKRIGSVRQAVGCVLALVIACGCAVVSAVATDVFEVMNGITNPTITTLTRTVYVRYDDPAQTLSDAAGYDFAVLENYDTEHSQQAISQIERELGREIQVTRYATVAEMVNALYDGGVDAIIIDSAYVEILEDNETYADFAQRTRELYAVPIIAKVEPTEPTETVDPEQNVTNTPFVVYISGSDTRSNSLPDRTRSDVNILAVVNPVTKQVLLLNTPRDYYVPNPAGNGASDKLTHCGIYGIDCSISALEGLYDLEVDYYARINFTGFETLIDAIGGVTVYSDVGFTAGSYYINAGENYLNGSQALAFARERYHVAGGDNARGKNQMKVIKAVIEKATSGTTIISNYSQILDSLQGMFVTSMATSDISQLVKMQLSDMASWNVVSYAVTGNNGSAVTYSAPGEYLSVMYINEEMVAHASELVDRVIAGEILTEADVQ